MYILHTVYYVTGINACREPAMSGCKQYYTLLLKRNKDNVYAFKSVTTTHINIASHREDSLKR